MKSIRVDPVNRTARVEPGANWRDFDLEAQAFGLATTGGLVSSTGVAGFTLGGGIGWLVRKHGLSLDNLASVDVITADGELVTASMDQNADLFWGVRGGGGNFGIVSSFEFRLHPVGPTVMGGLVLHRASAAKELMRFFNDFANKAPDELTMLMVFLTAPPLPFIPSDLVGTRMVAVACCYAGSLDEGGRVLQPLKKFGTPVADLIEPVPYAFLQSSLDDTAPPGIRNFWKTSYLKDLDDETIRTALEFFERIPSPMSSVHFHQLGGTLARVDEDATAFGNRHAKYAMNIVSGWQEPGEDEKNIGWSKEFFDAMRKFSTGAAYVNFLGDEGQDRVRAAYGEEKYKKLAQLKKKYDPSNVFHMNQNIKPGP
jgi:FAD/FMN-containing dehydrogenase